ncbi:unnamed protein product [Hapterophycus canaliculatus]
MATTLNRIINHKAKWHLIDAKGQIVGRLAAQIAPIIRGKHKPTFCPNDDCGDVVVVVNASAVEFTGEKWHKKHYRWHTGFPGGLKERPADDQLVRRPEEILRRAVVGMLPKNGLRKRMATKLLIYPGPSHPHEDRLPEDSALSLLEKSDRKLADRRPEDIRKYQDDNYVEWP